MRFAHDVDDKRENLNSCKTVCSPMYMCVMRYGNSRKNISHNACYLKFDIQNNTMSKEERRKKLLCTHKISLEPQNIHMRIVGWVEKSSQQNFLFSPVCAEKINTEIFSIGKNSADISQLDSDSNRWAFFFEKFSTSFTQKEELSYITIHIKYKVQCKII